MHLSGHDCLIDSYLYIPYNNSTSKCTIHSRSTAYTTHCASASMLLKSFGCYWSWELSPYSYYRKVGLWLFNHFGAQSWVGYRWCRMWWVGYSCQLAPRWRHPSAQPEKGQIWACWKSLLELFWASLKTSEWSWSILQPVSYRPPQPLTLRVSFPRQTDTNELIHCNGKTTGQEWTKPPIDVFKCNWNSSENLSNEPKLGVLELPLA